MIDPPPEVGVPGCERYLDEGMALPFSLVNTYWAEGIEGYFSRRCTCWRVPSIDSEKTGITGSAERVESIHVLGVLPGRVGSKDTVQEYQGALCPCSPFNTKERYIWPAMIYVTAYG